MNIRQLKMQAVAQLNEGKGIHKPILTGSLYVCICMIFSVLTNRLYMQNFGSNEINSYMKYAVEGDLERCLALVARCAPPEHAYLFALLLKLAEVILAAGFVIYLLNVVKKNAACIENLLDGFGFFWKVLLLELVKDVLIGLWSLLLIVPGVIAFYRYRMAIYILCEDPRKGVLRCLRESKEMMRGHKKELFSLDLSFFGWYIACLLPYIGYFAKFYATPYIGLTVTGYYTQLKEQAEAYEY